LSRVFLEQEIIVQLVKKSFILWFVTVIKTDKGKEEMREGVVVG
jgi:hypothetical protein